MGGRIVGVAVLEVFYNNRTPLFVKVQELHSTKGWKHPVVVNANHFSWAPVVGSFSWASNTRKGGPPKPPSVVEFGYHPMRHPWQRKKAIWDELREKLGPEYALV